MPTHCQIAPRTTFSIPTTISSVTISNSRATTSIPELITAGAIIVCTEHTGFRRATFTHRDRGVRTINTADEIEQASSLATSNRTIIFTWHWEIPTYSLPL